MGSNRIGTELDYYDGESNQRSALAGLLDELDERAVPSGGACAQTPGLDEQEEHAERAHARPLTSAVAAVGADGGSALADRPLR
jgi:hypothetical protein